MAKKLIISKEKLHKLKLASEREERKAQGYFDGRFAPKVEKDKSKYNRNIKHKGRGYDKI